MMVSMVTEGAPCGQCGLTPRGLFIYQVRINKRSLRTTGGSGLGFMPRFCDECKAPLGTSVVRQYLKADDAAKVDAYRARRWPSPGSEPAEPIAPGGP